jgi:hypothetical protein
MTKSVKMIEKTKIQNSILDTETITSDPNYNITVDAQQHTITYHVHQAFTDEIVDEGDLAVIMELVDTLGIEGSVLTLTATPNTMHEGGYISLNVTLTDTENNPIQGDVNLFDEDTLLGTVTTDSTGHASRNVQVRSGVQSILYTAQYLGYHTYNGSLNTTMITVSQFVDPYTNLLSPSHWTCYTTTPPKTGDTQCTSPNITTQTSPVAIKFGTNTYYIYDKTLQDFKDSSNPFQFILKKMGGDGRFDIGFVNMDTGQRLGYSTYISGQLKFVNEETGYSVARTSQEPKYSIWNEILFEVTDTALKMYYNSQQRAYKIESIPLPTSSLDKWYFTMAPYRGGNFLLTKDNGVIQQRARED